jgi:hypothetical protein
MRGADIRFVAKHIVFAFVFFVCSVIVTKDSIELSSSDWG